MTERPAEVATLVERMTRLVLLARMEGKDVTSARQGFTTTLRPGPALLRPTLTDDRGKERDKHERLAGAAGDPGVRCRSLQPVATQHPRAHHGAAAPVSAQGTVRSGYTQRELHAMAHRLTTRPRTCVNVATSLEVSAQLRHHSPVARGT